MSVAAVAVMLSADLDAETTVPVWRRPAPTGVPSRKCYAVRMSNDTKWIIGTVVGAAIAVITIQPTVMSMPVAGVNGRIDDLRAAMNARIDGVNARFDGVIDRLDRFADRMDGFDSACGPSEITFGKVDPRLETVERVLLPAPDGDDDE